MRAWPCFAEQVPSFAPEFIPRLLIEVNNAKGPRQLAQLVSDHGPHMPAQHVASVLSRLAGFATDGGLDEEQVWLRWGCPPVVFSHAARQTVRTAKAAA